MSDEPTAQPDHELDRDTDPAPEDESPQHPDAPEHPSTSGADGSETPQPEDADEGKDPGDISAAQVV